MSAAPLLDVEILAQGASDEDLLEPGKVRRLCALAAASAGVHGGHLAIELVEESRIRELNAAHRGKDSATDVLSFPIDGVDPIEAAGSIAASIPMGGAGLIDVAPLDEVPRELGDVVICPEHTADLYEAIVHGVLHLVGLDHECDDGEMLALQAEIMRWEVLGQ